MRYLAARGYETITIADLLDYVDHGTPLPDKSVMLTFDDGYLNNCVYLPPLMEKYGMSAIVSPSVNSPTNTLQTATAASITPWRPGTTSKRSRRLRISELQNHSYHLHA